MGHASDRTLAERFRSQLLTGPPAVSGLDVVERLLAVQAQDLRGARLALRARSEGVFASDIDRALTQDRSLVVSWLNRGTLHLVRSEDYPMLQALTAPAQVTGNERRLRQESVSPDQAEEALRVIQRALANQGPLVRKDLGTVGRCRHPDRRAGTGAPADVREPEGCDRPRAGRG